MNPLIQMTADEVNHLIYAYLRDSGFEHTAFTLRTEGQLDRSHLFNRHIPRGELVELLSKSLLYVEVETHWRGDTMVTECKAPFSLLRRHECSSEGIGAETNGYSDEYEQSRSNGIDNVQKRKAEPLVLEEPRVEKRAKRSAEPEASDDYFSLPSVSKKKDSKSDSSVDMDRASQPAVNTPSAEIVKKAKTKKAPGPGDDTTPLDAILSLTGHAAEVFVCAWNPKAPELLATGSKDATVRIWNMPNPPDNLSEFSRSPLNPPVILKHLPNSDQRDITSLDWNPDGTLLATGSYDSILRVWTAPGEHYMSHPQHQGPIFATRFSKSGRWLLSASLDGTACVWDVSEKKLYMQFRCHAECCLDVDWLDDSTFASCGADRLIHIMQLGNPSPIKTFDGHTNEVNQIKFNPSRTRLASCSDDQTARIWNITNLFRKPEPDSIPGLGTTTKPDSVITLKGHSDSIGSIGWCPAPSNSGHEIMATTSFDGTARLWDATTGECLRAISDHKRAAYTLTFSPEGKFLATGSGDGWLYIYNVATKERVWSWYAGHDKPGIYEIDWQQKGGINRIAMCLESRAVGVVDVTRVPALMAYM
ncbi:WD40 repeat-like protein [Rickenella mellea]|uniref:WD40 repeat-like protein n=1 Tax=Rickenella mellea TaxID=50990 RepID=A0A4Y7QN64_9AGAM|nr:WD40 repeat-like protein [Rickenella mellea]